MSVQSVFEPQALRRPTLPSERESFAGEQLVLDGPTVSFERGEEIYGEGESADYVYQVVSGAVRTSRLLSDGRRQLEEFYYTGDCFGLETGVEHRATAEALSDASVRRVKRSTLSALALSDAEAARRLWKMTAESLRRSQDHVLMLGRRSATERLAGFLLDLATRLKQGARLDLPMSRQDIADYLGLTIETVSRTFTQLQGAGVIDITACRHIAIRDRHELEEICA